MDAKAPSRAANARRGRSHPGQVAPLGHLAGFWLDRVLRCVPEQTRYWIVTSHSNR